MSLVQESVQNLVHSCSSVPSGTGHSSLVSKLSSLVPLHKKKRITQQVSPKTLGEPEHLDVYPSVPLCQGRMPPLLEQKYRISLKREEDPTSEALFFVSSHLSSVFPLLSLCSPFLAPHTATTEIKELHASPSFSLLYT